MAKRTTKDDEITRQRIETDEISPERSGEEARIEIQSAIIVARRFKRSETEAYGKLLKACERTTFAEEAMYSFPRWSSEEDKFVDITGPSVKLAREAGRVWGNIRWGFIVIADGEETRTIEGWAYDLETNARISQQDTFTKFGYAKGGGWKPLNERGLRETTSRRGAFLIRNSLLQLIPSDFIDDAMATAEKTLADSTRKDPSAEKKKIITAFSTLNVPIAELETFLGHSLDSVSPAELKRLRGIYKSIEDGNSTWAEYTAKSEPSAPKTEKKPTAPAPKMSTNDVPVAATLETAATPEPEVPDADCLNTDEKGLVWQVARKKRWAVGKGEPNDPLHALLKERYGVDSVTKVRRENFKELINLLREDPKE